MPQCLAISVLSVTTWSCKLVVYVSTIFVYGIFRARIIIVTSRLLEKTINFGFLRLEWLWWIILSLTRVCSGRVWLSGSTSWFLENSPGGFLGFWWSTPLPFCQNSIHSLGGRRDGSMPEVWRVMQQHGYETTTLRTLGAGRFIKNRWMKRVWRNKPLSASLRT